MLDIIIGILLIFLIPLTTGLLFALLVGSPIYLLMKGTEYFFYWCINPVVAIIREIPLIGPLLCFFLTLGIGLPLFTIIVVYIFLPVIAIVVHAISFGRI